MIASDRLCLPRIPNHRRVVQVALKKHIAEFLDHHLVRTRSGTGGQQCYWCSLPGDTMKAIVEAEGK